MRMVCRLLAVLSLLCAGVSGEVVGETVDVAEVPAGFPVGFALLSTPDRQYVAYYDADHVMTVGSRRLVGGGWIYQKLPSKVGWDSHNYVTMALDGAGHLHVSGNMHCVPLVYFRTRVAGDIATLEPAAMTGEMENRVTYPQFFKDGEGRLLFTYRHGGSGNGINLYNRYDLETKTWSRLLDTPLFDGEGERNAYPGGTPVRGPDGWFHIHWVWRDTPDCATNQRLSYARSRDLTHWESAFGQNVDLPIRYGQDALVVDPVPPGGGIINGGHRLGFDGENKPVLVYHKTDAAGNMQIFAAKPDAGKWIHRALTQWKEPVPFAGNGSMGFIGIRITGLDKAGAGSFAVDYQHKDHGRGTLRFDGKTLQVIQSTIAEGTGKDPLARKVESDFPGMEIRRAHDLGSCGRPGVRYVLEWETLEANRDRAREGPLPADSTLRLHKITEDRARR